MKNEARQPSAEAPILHFTYGRKQKREVRKMASRGFVEEIDENDALVELPVKDPNKVSVEDLVVDDEEVEDDNLPPV